MTLGRPRLHLRVTGSTNERARALAAAGAPHGTLVTAGEQTAGRGRQGRSWSAPPGAALAALAGHPRARPAAAAARRPRGRRPRGRRRAREVAQRRAARRPQGRRHPRRGPPAGGLGGARDRRQRGARPRRCCRRSCATSPARSGARRASSSRRSTSCCARSSARLAEPGAPALAALRERDALLGRPVRWAGGAGTRRGDRRRRRAAGARSRTGRCTRSTRARCTWAAHTGSLGATAPRRAAAPAARPRRWPRVRPAARRAALARTACVDGALRRPLREAYGDDAVLLPDDAAHRAGHGAAAARRRASPACFAVGCSSLGSFSARFTEIVGETSSAFRARDHSDMQVVPACQAMILTRPRRPAQESRIEEASRVAAPGSAA